MTFTRLAAAVALSAAALASPLAAAGPSTVPFKAELTTQEVIAPNASRCSSYPYLAGSSTGSGHASHLGSVTLAASDCVMPQPDGTFAFGDGRLVFTAANGDQLTVDYFGTLQPTPTPGVYTVVDGGYIVTGGTGRFQGATGSGTLEGTQNIVTGQAQYRASGTISY